MDFTRAKRQLDQWNPWWSPNGIEHDTDLIKLKKSQLNYQPVLFTQEDLLKDSVYTLRGPRRAGKTFALKIAIHNLIKSGALTGTQIVWMSFDTIKDLQDAEDLLMTAMELSNPKCIFIDEATSLKNWQRLIKKMRDNGVLADRCTVLTGSSSADLKLGAERMAGRKGLANPSERVLLPMSFLSFCDQLGYAGIELPKTVAYQEYLIAGGFPFRVNEYIQLKKKNTGLHYAETTGFEIFDDILFYEINRRKLDRNLGLAVFERILETQVGSISYQSFSKSLGIAKETPKRYLDVLGDAFLLSTISSYDTGRGRVSLKKEKKLAWIDPALGGLGPWLKSHPSSPPALRAEWAVHLECLRHFESRLFEGISAPRSVYTWKSKAGNEVDFLLVDRSKKLLLPIEVKYQNQISDWDFLPMEKAFKRGVLVSKDFSAKRPLSSALPAYDFENYLVDLLLKQG